MAELLTALDADNYEAIKEALDNLEQAESRKA